MRTDAIIDKRQVKLSYRAAGMTIGHDKLVAQVGDIITFTEGITERVGRMIGRVHYAPALGETPAVRDYILAIVLGSELDHTFERWVNPADVTRCSAVRDQHEVLTWFFSPDVPKVPFEDIRMSLSHGWSTYGRYKAWRDKLDADIAELEARPKCACGRPIASDQHATCIHCRLKARAEETRNV